MADFWFGFQIQKRVVGLWQHFEVAQLQLQSLSISQGEDLLF